VTDDPTTDVPDQPDERDEHVARLLDVPPLDDLTRRRLVTRALAAADEPVDEAPAATPAAGTTPPRGRRVLAAAAAVAAVVAVGAGVISALRDDGGSGSTNVAGRDARQELDATAPDGGGRGDQGTAEAPAPLPPGLPRAAIAGAAPLALGDVGDVADTARLRATVRGTLADGGRLDQQQRGVGTACATTAPAGTSPVAVGTGRDEGIPVAVVVVAEDLDRFRLLVLDATTCAVRSEIAL
jgi:hypothetical protein